MASSSKSAGLRALLAAAVVIVGLVSGCGGNTNPAATQAATAAAQQWLSEIDHGQYAQSWQDASAVFQTGVPKQAWISDVTAARKPLGELVARNLESAQYTTHLPGAPDGQYVVMRFDTSYANKKSGIETVTFMLEKDGQWRSAGYFIR